jgi:sporulation protein YlmC with PRC-barrel domain
MTTPNGCNSAIRTRTVLGTSVFNRNGRKIGTVEDIVLDKTSSRIMFVVLGFGGLLGLGEHFHPIPWSRLDFDQLLGGYIVDIGDEQLRAAPHDSIDELTREYGAAYSEHEFNFCGARPDWM